MTKCRMQRFTNITPQHFARILESVQATGINIMGNQGSASYNGIHIGWDFDPDLQILDIRCIAAPFYVSCEMIKSRIHRIVNSTEHESHQTPSPTALLH